MFSENVNRIISYFCSVINFDEVNYNLETTTKLLSIIIALFQPRVNIAWWVFSMLIAVVYISEKKVSGSNLFYLKKKILSTSWSVSWNERICSKKWLSFNDYMSCLSTLFLSLKFVLHCSPSDLFILSSRHKNKKVFFWWEDLKFEGKDVMR